LHRQLGITLRCFLARAPARAQRIFGQFWTGDLLIGVNDAGEVVGIELDQFDSNDKFMLHLAQMVRNGLGDRAGTCIDPRVQKLNGNFVCLVTCQRSPEPVFLKWSGITPDAPEGDFTSAAAPVASSCRRKARVNTLRRASNADSKEFDDAVRRPRRNRKCVEGGIAEVPRPQNT
jgi:Schlafen, AlbA_2